MDIPKSDNFPKFELVNKFLITYSNTSSGTGEKERERERRRKFSESIIKISAELMSLMLAHIQI